MVAIMAMTSNSQSYIDMDYIDAYVELLVGKIFKLLPMKEQDNPTLLKYHESLMVELTGFSFVAKEHVDKALLVSIISSINGLLDIDDMKLYKRKVFECINATKRLV